MENGQRNLTNKNENITTDNSEELNSGLDAWNDRLDENFESEKNNDPIADEKAKDFSEEDGSGDQSDQA
ncbi:hypothetical protein [Pedobacter mucosus]|uniref:hypothetical protein n=1 Tax=Pedobacter mucosus TaxID=2895286 RepID=UPI001EE4DB7E|nr:hypothetical protein [Pedobacter mucosus]UKT65117.1 hypothetical protein LOK61_04900 [Pedobacter mucosus]